MSGSRSGESGDFAEGKHTRGLMFDLSIAAYDEADAIERMLDDGAPISIGVQRAARPAMRVLVEPSPEERAAARRAARHTFRLYCMACGRSVELATPPASANRSRCGHCGGTLLLEPSAD